MVLGSPFLYRSVLIVTQVMLESWRIAWLALSISPSPLELFQVSVVKRTNSGEKAPPYGCGLKLMVPFLGQVNSPPILVYFSGDWYVHWGL